MYCDFYDACPNRKRFSCDRQEAHPGLPHCVRVSDEHHIQLARRHALKRAELLGMSSLDGYYVATAVSELANNQFFHTENGGVIQFYRIEKDDRVGIEVVAQDDGPGIACIKAAMIDGYSSNCGLGGGLGGTERLMDEFEIESEVGTGTRIVARKWVTTSQH
ncbi:MAG: anti-sigma regulatory factor [Mariprofundus sp.]